MHFLLLIVTFCTIAFGAGSGNPFTYHVDTSSTNLTTSFVAVPQLSGPANALSVVQVYNGSSTEIEVNCSEPAKPSSNSADSFYVPGTTGFQTPVSPAINAPLGKVCWVRSNGSTISSGIIQIVGWGY